MATCYRQNEAQKLYADILSENAKKLNRDFIKISATLMVAR